MQRFAPQEEHAVSVAEIYKNRAAFSFEVFPPKTDGGMDESDVASKISNRTLIIPGKVAVMKGEIQDKLPDWNVVVGTREAVEIVKFLRDGEHIKAAEAAAAAKKPAEDKKQADDVNAPLNFEKISASIPKIEVVDMARGSGRAMRYVLIIVCPQWRGRAWFRGQCGQLH